MLSTRALAGHSGIVTLVPLELGSTIRVPKMRQIIQTHEGLRRISNKTRHDQKLKIQVKELSCRVQPTKHRMRMSLGSNMYYHIQDHSKKGWTTTQSCSKLNQHNVKGLGFTSDKMTNIATKDNHFFFCKGGVGMVGASQASQDCFMESRRGDLLVFSLFHFPSQKKKPLRCCASCVWKPKLCERPKGSQMLKG